MYSRSYYPEESAIRIPDGYDGTALIEPPPTPEIAMREPVEEAQKKEVKVSPREAEEEEKWEKTLASEKESDPLSGKWQMPPFLKNIIPADLGFSSLIPSIGSEELIIAAIALFLFFSKGGDKLCSAILLFLIFIK